MKLFKNIFMAELIKVQYTFAIALLIVVAAAVPIFVAVEYLNHSEKIIMGMDVNPWTEGWKRTNVGLGIFAGPCIIVMLAALLMHIEHKQHAWKYLLTLPVPMGFVYLNKLIIYVLLVLFFYLTAFVVFFLCGIAVGIMVPKSRFLVQTPEFIEMFVLFLRSFVACLAIVAIHFWLSIRIRNMFVHMAYALMMIFFAMAAYQAMEHIWYFPYNFGEMTVFKKHTGNFILAKHECFSLVICLVVSALGYLDFTKRFRG